MATQVADQTSILGLENPMGTDGFEFVEYTAPDIELLRSLFTKMGFPGSPGTRARTSRFISRATATSSSTLNRAATPRTTPRLTAQAPAQWRSGSRMLTPLTSGR